MVSTKEMAVRGSDQEYLNAVIDMVPRIREMADRIEEERQPPAELVEELRQAGAFHLLLPKSLGGLEVSPVIAARVVEEAARGDGSVGWALMVAAQQGSLAGFLPEEDAHEIWADGGVVAGVARPIGKAVWTTDPEPGYIVSGRWPFASGSDHAAWFAGEAMVYDGDTQRLDADGNEVSRVILVPRESVTIHDTWDTIGLRGTASHDFSTENTFVPVSRGFQMLVSPPVHPWPVYRVAPLIFMNHGSQALGVARAAIETASELAKVKLGWGNAPLVNQTWLQQAVAEATALVESASEYMYGTAERLWEAAQKGEDTPEERARLRLAASNAATASVKAVDMMYEALATTAIFKKTPLERHYRDIHTASSHVMIGAMTYQAAGRVILGQEPGFPFF